MELIRGEGGDGRESGEDGRESELAVTAGGNRMVEERFVRDLGKGCFGNENMVQLSNIILELHVRKIRRINENTLYKRFGRDAAHQ